MNVLCHRHSNRFWKVLLRQGVDFSKIDTKVIWAGEHGGDRPSRHLPAEI